MPARAKKRIAALCAACLLCGCAIFDLKDGEPPSPGGEPDDPLYIADIIRAVNPNVISGMNYEDYFTDTAAFLDYRQFQINRREIIQMLERLRSHSSPSLRVEWRVTNRIFEGNNSYRLDDVSYAVYLNGAQTYSGTATFRILGDKIYDWRDVPNNGKPFFDPYPQ